MGRGPAAARPSSGTARHQQFRARAKTRVDDLQEMFSGLQSARKESRSTDAAVLEAQLHQMLREWRAELSVPSPASSLQARAPLNFFPASPPPLTISGLLGSRFHWVAVGGQDMKPEPREEAVASPADLTVPQSPSQGVIASGGGMLAPAAAAVFHDQGCLDIAAICHSQVVNVLVTSFPPVTFAAAIVEQLCPTFHVSRTCIGGGSSWRFVRLGKNMSMGIVMVVSRTKQMYYVNQELTVEDFLYDDNYKMYLPGSNPDVLSNLEGTGQLEYPQFNLPQELPPNTYLDMSNCGQSAGDVFLHMSDLLTTMSPAPAAFLRPKCALWDCPRPAQGSERWQDYCSMYHADLAVKEEGPPGTMPVIRPRGIDLKDGPLFAALSAKIQGKHVGIPVCEGAATAKSPWNAPELFDLYIFEGESIREWLFFDKPRRAFESGNRKQRSLPDYTGRGWHESRKQVMKDFGGLKRSYYMDPQPSSSYEWHLYEYEINDCDAFALYRLEFKSSDAKKTAKSKLACNPLNEIQQQMVRLSADSPVENKRSARSRTKANPNDINSNIYSVQNTTAQGGIPNAYQAVSQVDQMTYLNGNVVYGPHLPYGYSTERSDFYWSSNDGA
uniref:Transcription factor VOZ1 n=1 Tax=Oryza brachyantha TaxID=4533 RepID=J3L452_ORYBR